MKTIVPANASGNTNSLNDYVKQQTKKLSSSQQSVYKYVKQTTKKNPLTSPDDSLLSALIEEDDSMVSEDISRIEVEGSKRTQIPQAPQLSKQHTRGGQKRDENKVT
jgi:hypothetical protein